MQPTQLNEILFEGAFFFFIYYSVSGIKGHSQTTLTRGGGWMYGSPKISTFIKQKIPTWGQGGTELVKKIVKVLCEPKILKIGGNTLYRQA